MKTFLLICVAVGLVVGGFAADLPWMWGLGLLVGLVALLSDRDPIKLDGREHNTETTMGVRRMRSKDLQ